MNIVINLLNDAPLIFMIAVLVRLGWEFAGFILKKIKQIHLWG